MNDNLENINDNIEFLFIDKSVSKKDSNTLKRISYEDLSDTIKEFNTNNPTKGTVGIEGDAGIPGQKGEAGLKGQKGLKGQQGLPGAQGIKGEPGIKGEVGVKGEKGFSGKNGIKGKTGLKGEPGTKGIKGVPGLKGKVGLKGNTGEIGFSGDIGSKGFKGNSTSFIKGQKGRKGAKGYGRVGQTGEKGSFGNSGQKGSKGKKGRVGFDNNIITKALDMNGSSWQHHKSDELYLDIKKEIASEFSRILIKIKRGVYYNRFILDKDSYSEIGMQLYDPLRNSSTPINQYIYDNDSQIMRPMIITTENHKKIDYTDSSTKKIKNEYYISIRIFFEGTYKRIPFTSYYSDVY